MEIGGLRIPRPAFLSDLAAANEGRRGVRVLVIIDGWSREAQSMLGRWGDVFAGSSVVTVADQGLAGRMAGEGLDARSLGAWGGGRLSGEAVRILGELEPFPRLIVTCEPYDAYGTLVKRELETSIMPLLGRWGAVFLVHDPVYGTVRAYDVVLLRDRLDGRPKRLRAYSMVVRLCYRVASVLARDQRRGWRRA